MGVALCLRFMIGFVFFVSGLAKLRSNRRFHRALGGYVLLRGRPKVRRALGRTIPVIEVALGVLVGSARLGGVASLAAGGTLLAPFTLAIAVNARQGVQSSCGCGIGDAATDWISVGRNLVLIASLVAAAAISPTATVADSDLTASNIAGLAVLAAVLALIVMLIPTVLAEINHQLEHVA